MSPTPTAPAIAPADPPRLNPPVFWTSTALLGLMALFAAVFPDRTGALSEWVQSGIITHGSWYYVLVVAVITVTVSLVGLTGYGDIKLGPDHSEPDYSLISWFSMLFSAGMGIGLLFFGVAEPVMHFLSPPSGPGGTALAAEEAMILTFFHWGLHPWAIYAVVALILAYFAYRHDQPLTLRSALYPLIGERVHGPIGHAVDVFAILGTACGVATTLGFGVAQINTGLHELTGLPISTPVQLGLIVITTGAATLSVVSGLDRGIKLLSEINIALAIALLLLVLVTGPTVLLMASLMQNTGNYLSEIVYKTFNLYAYAPNEWIGGWTIFYWGWWMSWSPFVGLFIARISRGRTIREFVLGVMLVPAAFTALWMTVFGNTAIDLILHGGMVELGETVQTSQPAALFVLLQQLPLSTFVSSIAVFMILVFFVTSADSGAMVLNMLSCHGRDDTPAYLRIFWMAVIAIIATTLMLAGGLGALQTAAVASALPFSFALLLGIWGFLRAIAIDHAKRQAIITGPSVPDPSSEPWQRRLGNLLSYPGADEVERFRAGVVLPAMRDFRVELQRNGVDADVIDADATADSHGERVARLEVRHGDEIDFVYAVHNRAASLPDEALVGRSSSDQGFHRAEVHLSEGGQDYDIMGWSRDQVVLDILQQYERHLHFLKQIR